MQDDAPPKVAKTSRRPPFTPPQRPESSRNRDAFPPADRLGDMNAMVMALAARNWTADEYLYAWVRIHPRLRDLSQEMFEEGDHRLFNVLAAVGLETIVMGDDSL